MVSAAKHGLGVPRQTRAFVPRSARPKAWFDRAYARARAGGAPVIEAVTAGFAAQSGPQGRINTHKSIVDSLIRRGAVEARTHYGDIARVLPRNLDSALVELDRSLASERRHLEMLQSCGPLLISTVDNHMRIDRLRRARLVLRLMRRYGDADGFPELRDDVATLSPVVAAIREFREETRPVRRAGR